MPRRRTEWRGPAGGRHGAGAAARSRQSYFQPDVTKIPLGALTIVLPRPPPSSCRLPAAGSAACPWGPQGAGGPSFPSEHMARGPERAPSGISWGRAGTAPCTAPPPLGRTVVPQEVMPGRPVAASPCALATWDFGPGPPRGSQKNPELSTKEIGVEEPWILKWVPPCPLFCGLAWNTRWLQH